MFQQLTESYDKYINCEQTKIYRTPSPRRAAGCEVLGCVGMCVSQV